MWGLSSAVISSLHNSLHPQQKETDLPKTACDCSCGGVIKKKKKEKKKVLINGHTRNPLCGIHLLVDKCRYLVTHRVQLWNVTTTTTKENSHAGVTGNDREDRLARTLESREMTEQTDWLERWSHGK